MSYTARSHLSVIVFLLSSFCYFLPTFLFLSLHLSLLLPTPTPLFSSSLLLLQLLLLQGIIPGHQSSPQKSFSTTQEDLKPPRYCSVQGLGSTPDLLKLPTCKLVLSKRAKKSCEREKRRKKKNRNGHTTFWTHVNVILTFTFLNRLCNISVDL